MSKKIRTINDLQDALDADLGWRIKEIDILLTLVRRPPKAGLTAILRAAMPIVYAHWEGFIKVSASHYLEYVYYKKHRYRELKVAFVTRGLRGRLNQLSDTQKFLQQTLIIDFLLERFNDPASFEFEIHTASNLSSAVFEDILISIGLDPSPYATRKNFLDHNLLRPRNEIAHGEDVPVAASDFPKVVADTIALIRQFKNDLENAASLGSYRK